MTGLSASTLFFEYWLAIGELNYLWALWLNTPLELRKEHRSTYDKWNKQGDVVEKLRKDTIEAIEAQEKELSELRAKP